MTVRVAVLDDYQDVALSYADWSVLDGRAEVTAFSDHLDDEDALAERLAPFDVIAIMRERTAFPRALLERLPALKLLITTGPVNAAVDTAALRDSKVTFCGTGGAGGSSTPELAWGLVLAVTRGIVAQDVALRAGRWQLDVRPQLAGATLGLLGLGRIGKVLAGYGQAFGMDVTAWSTNLTDAAAAEVGVRRVEKDELFAGSRVVVIATRLSDRTRGAVAARELALLGPDGYLVNISRGPIVDENALVTALNDGTIAGAGLDVYDVEPLPADSPLRTAPNTVLTPHLGYVVQDAFRRMYEHVVEDVAGWLDGTPVRVIA